MTIELTLGKPVKWQVGDAWHTGRVLEADVIEQTWRGIQPMTLVKDTCTSRVFAVEEGQLQDNDFRIGEKIAELLAEFVASDPNDSHGFYLTGVLLDLKKRHKEGENVAAKFAGVEKQIREYMKAEGTNES